MGDVLTVVLSSAPGVLTALGTLWYTMRKQRRSDKKADARIVWEDREKEIDVAHVEQQNAVGFFKALMLERKKAHEHDMQAVYTQLGEMGRKLNDCERKHTRKDRLLIQLIERMKGRELLTDTEATELYRRAEEDSDDPDT